MTDPSETKFLPDYLATVAGIEKLFDLPADTNQAHWDADRSVRWCDSLDGIEPHLLAPLAARFDRIAVEVDAMRAELVAAVHSAASDVSMTTTEWVAEHAPVTAQLVVTPPEGDISPTV